jgi:hypothetical protein
MDEIIIKKLGLRIDDFQGRIDTQIELLENILSSAILCRKVVAHIVLRNLRRYFNNPDLQLSDSLKGYFKYGERLMLWNKFRDSFEFNAPGLKTSKWVNQLILIYIVVYIYFSLKIHSLKSIPSIADRTLTLALASIFAAGLILPIGLILYYGTRELPFKNVEELVDQIMQENIYDLYTDDKKQLKELLENEINLD